MVIVNKLIFYLEVRETLNVLPVFVWVIDKGMQRFEKQEMLQYVTNAPEGP